MGRISGLPLDWPQLSWPRKKRVSSVSPPEQPTGRPVRDHWMDQPARETSSLSTPGVEQGSRDKQGIRERRHQREDNDTYVAAFCTNTPGERRTRRPRHVTDSSPGTPERPAISIEDPPTAAGIVDPPQCGRRRRALHALTRSLPATQKPHWVNPAGLLAFASHIERRPCMSLRNARRRRTGPVRIAMLMSAAASLVALLSKAWPL